LIGRYGVDVAVGVAVAVGAGDALRVTGMTAAGLSASVVATAGPDPAVSGVPLSLRGTAGPDGPLDRAGVGTITVP
jgi:hypothetical protein